MRDGIESAKLNMELKTILPEIDKILARVETYTSCIASLWNGIPDDEFLCEMHMKQADLLRLINKLNDIGMRAMAINNQDIYYICEDKKLEVRNVMEAVRNLYM